jgi:electron transport complex protein RnfG
MARLDVTRDPMPEDWRGALKQRGRVDAGTWNTRYAELRAREAARPIYAVTGATISSRALTDGVRTAIQHFQKRWALLEPNLPAAAPPETGPSASSPEGGR